MKKRHERLGSKFMQRPMHLWCYGDWGTPLLVFPTAAGFAHEWDSHGMIELLAPFIHAGKLKVYCPESNIAQTWTKRNEPREAAYRHHLYESFIMQELIPWIYADCHRPQLPVATTGSSLGGYYAATFALKHPETFHYALCTSGRYDLTQFTGGYSNAEIYYNNPLAFVANLEGPELERVRNHTQITLVCGRGAYEEGCIEETLMLGKLLREKGIPNYIDIWGKEAKHDWNFWKRQIAKHLRLRFGPP